MTRLWIVEIDRGGTNWVPICYCFGNAQADQVANRIVGETVRVREYGTPADSRETQKTAPAREGQGGC